MGESTSTMFMSIGMVRELSHLVSNCQLKKIKFQDHSRDAKVTRNHSEEFFSL